MKLQQIVSAGGMLIATASDSHTNYNVIWHKGTHTANVYPEHGEPDCFTFSWEKNTTTMLDFTTALQNWIEYSQEVNA